MTNEPRLPQARQGPVPRIITIPAADRAFRKHVATVVDAASDSASIDEPRQLENRLRRLFPRAVVRERQLSGEPPSWYVYRDGGWLPSMTATWWKATGLPRVAISREGWVIQANATARSLLGIHGDETGSRHFTDFVAPGTLDDSQSLFRSVDEGNELTATVLLRPVSGEVIAIDLHAAREGDELVAVFRLADDVRFDSRSVPVTVPIDLGCAPAGDAQASP